MHPLIAGRLSTLFEQRAVSLVVAATAVIVRIVEDHALPSMIHADGPRERRLERRQQDLGVCRCLYSTDCLAIQA